MRKLRFPAAVLVATAIAFTSCDGGGNPDDNSPYRRSVVITFDEAVLPPEGYLLGGDYTEKGLTFNQYSEEMYWEGMAVSNNTDRATPGYQNQYSVYSTGGYGGHGKFAVAQTANFYGTPAGFSFEPGEEYEVEYIYINNSTYAALSILNGDGEGGFARKFEQDDWFFLTITGYDAAGAETAHVSVYLADYRLIRNRIASEPFLMTDWTKVELDGLGKVNKITFSQSSTDVNE